MKITNVKKLQQGGQMAPAQPAPEDQMMAQIEGLAQELLTNLGPDGCMALIEVLGAMLQSMQAPVNQPVEGQPVFRKGGKLARRVK